jgi:hypothetical protein
MELIAAALRQSRQGRPTQGIDALIAGPRTRAEKADMGCSLIQWLAPVALRVPSTKAIRVPVTDDNLTDSITWEIHSASKGSPHFGDISLRVFAFCNRKLRILRRLALQFAMTHRLADHSARLRDCPEPSPIDRGNL